MSWNFLVAQYHSITRTRSLIKPLSPDQAPASPHDSPIPRESTYPSNAVGELPLVLVKLVGQIQLLLDDAVPGNTTQHNLHWQVWVEQ